MRILVVTFLCCSLLAGCDYYESATPSGRVDRALGELSAARTEQSRFHALGEAAKESFASGQVKAAEEYATELLALAPRYRRNWDYGNAIHDGNVILGRIAALEGHVDEAKHYLQEAGKSPGSPQMNSFGPNMSLAKDLLEKGEKEAVSSYFEACRTFWGAHADQLDAWTLDVKEGRIPNFGPNLVY